MEKIASSFLSSRRRFLLNLLPAGTLFCLGCSNLLASGQEENKSRVSPGKHKFLENSEMNFKEVFSFAFQNGFIPIMQNLANEIGKEKFIEMLKKAASEVASMSIKKFAQNFPIKDIAAFISPMKEPNHFWKNVLTYEFVEEAEKSVEARVTECLWAKTFREANASDVGYVVICHPDFAAASAFNPKMKLMRTKTLMKGDEYCNHHWVMQG